MSANSGKLRGSVDDAEAMLNRSPGSRAAKGIYEYAVKSLDGASSARQGPGGGVKIWDDGPGGGGLGAPADLSSDHQGHQLFQGGLSGATLSQSLALKAQHKLAAGDLRGALLAATQAISADPTNAQAYITRAAILNKLGNFRAAALDATRSLSIDPRSPHALNERSWAFVKLKEFIPGLKDAEASLALDATQAAAHLNRAMALEGLGKLREALEEFRIAAKLDPALETFYEDAVAKYGDKVGWKDKRKGKFAKLRRRMGPLGHTGALLSLAVLGFAGCCFGLVMLLKDRSESAFDFIKRTTGAGRLRASSVKTPAAPAMAAPSPFRAVAAAQTSGFLIAGNYKIAKEIGRGGMGVVYEGMDMALQRTVAIKQMRPEIRQSSREAERFMAEARLVASLKHPNIVEIHSVLQENDELFLVFEHVSGRGLHKLLDEKRHLSAVETKKVLVDVCQALDYAHSKKVIHRDLKPSNIMIANDGIAKVMDFGIAHQAKITVAKLTSTEIRGTPAYMPPEQEMGLASKESDLYALGAMIYEMLTGEMPFTGPNFMLQKQRKMFRRPSELVSNLPKTLNDFFDRALQPEPADRFHSAADLLQAFEKSV
ncbi:MAG: protein kinase [Elusimicrobia bacterium]|nr:protein kinase [Elusimicrobiota bacterium]